MTIRTEKIEKNLGIGFLFHPNKNFVQ
jgi:hypothetical protein